MSNSVTSGDPAQWIKQSEPCAVVIFGASGDLTRRKLIPALWNLQVEGRLPKEISIVGMARTPKTNEEFRQECRDAICKFSRFKSFTEEQWDEFSAGLHYLEAQYDKEIPSRGIGEGVMQRLRTVDQVAYVRFASVYKEFRDVGEFVDEITALGKKPQK